MCRHQVAGPKSMVELEGIGCGIFAGPADLEVPKP